MPMVPPLLGAAEEERPSQRVPEYVRHDMRAKVFGSLFVHSAVLLALTKLTLFLMPLPELAESAGVGTTTTTTTTTTTPVPDAAETEPKWHVWSSFLDVVLVGLSYVGWGLFWALAVVGVVLAAVVLVAEIFNIRGFMLRRDPHCICNCLLVGLLLSGQSEIQLRTLLPGLLSILSAALILAAGANSALSARLQACSRDWVLDSAVQGRWTGRGVVLAGVKVAGHAPSTLPSLPLLLAWIAAAWFGHACAGAHSDVVIASFAVVWLFLIDADGPLQNGDPDDHLRMVVLLHSKVALLLLTAALQQFGFAIHGPSVLFRSFLFQVVVQQVNPAVRRFVVQSWPGPPPAELRLQAERLGLEEAERLRPEAQRLRLEAERFERLMLEARRLRLELGNLSWANDRERMQQILQRLQQIVQEAEATAARPRAAAAAEEELPV